MAEPSQGDPWQNLHTALNEGLRIYHYEQEERIKNFIQDASDCQRRYIEAAEMRLFLWLAFILIAPSALVALLGVRAGLALAAAAVALATFANLAWRIQFVRKRARRLRVFRERFRRQADNHELAWLERDKEDRGFREKCKDTILWPSVVAYERRDWKSRLDRDDLEHLAMLLADFESGHSHLGPGEDAKRCRLCASADRVRNNVRTALSALESDVASARERLGAGCGAIEPQLTFHTTYGFTDWTRWVIDDEGVLPSCSRKGAFKPTELLETVKGKQRWTFEEADKVRELARIGMRRGAPDYVDFELRELSSRVFDELSDKMATAANERGLADVWTWYNAIQEQLAKNEPAVAHIRRVIGRYHPDTMFRELNEIFGGIQVQLPGIEKWGYDSNMVTKEQRIARDFMAKNQSDWDREREKQLRVAQAFIEAERRERG